MANAARGQSGDVDAREMVSGTVQDIVILEGVPATGAHVGKLTTCVSEAGATVAFALLDFHDEAIRSMGQALVEADRTLMLCRGDRVLTQPASRTGNFVAELCDGPVRDALLGVAPLRSLLIIGSGRMSRAQLALIDGEGKTRARAELAILHPAGEGTPVTLAVLREVRGYGKELKALSSWLCAAPGGQDGLAGLVPLLFPAHQPYDPKPKTCLTAKGAAYDAANGIIHAYLAVMRQNEAGIIADHDSEFLHDYRVALRKIRSVLSLFRAVYDEAQTDALKRRFSDLMVPTGRLRDLDVYLLERQAYYDLLPEPLHDGLTLMFDIFRQERRHEHAKLVRQLEGAEYAEDMAGLEELFADGAGPARGPDAEHPVHDYACGLIWHRYRKVCKVASAIGTDTPDAEVHRLRINCKKLRYLMELFAPIFPRARTKALIQPLRELQDNLGFFNDYVVQQGALQTFLARHPATGHQDERSMAASIGALIALLHQRQMQERARIVTSFAHFDSPATRRDFASLFRRKGA